MIVEGLTLFTAVLAGRYLLPSKKARRMAEVTFQRLQGTYRDPAYYEVTVNYPGQEERYYKVRNVADIPDRDRAAVKDAFQARHQWLHNFLTGKDSTKEN